MGHFVGQFRPPVRRFLSARAVNDFSFLAIFVTIVDSDSGRTVRPISKPHHKTAS
jgi:hypothetical protein